jgi:hypothetical protein
MFPWCNKLRSALVALSLAFLPTLLDFAQYGQFTLDEVKGLARQLMVCVLILSYNWLQHYKAKKIRRRRGPQRKVQQ